MVVPNSSKCFISALRVLFTYETGQVREAREGAAGFSLSGGCWEWHGPEGLAPGPGGALILRGVLRPLRTELSRLCFLFVFSFLVLILNIKLPGLWGSYTRASQPRRERQVVEAFW